MDVVIEMNFRNYAKLFSSISAAMLMVALFATATAQETLGGATLTGDYSDHALDVDGDGRYDLLVIEVEVLVTNPAEYSVMGFLTTLDGKDVVWSIDHRKLEAGNQTMVLEFDGKSINESSIDGPYRLTQVSLTTGSSQSSLYLCDYVPAATITQVYRSSDFSGLVRMDKTISGTGHGELLVTFTVETEVPVHSGRYSYDIVGINIPPISTPFKVISLKGLEGRIFEMPNVTMAAKPNNFTIMAEGVKNLNVGLKKPQGEKIRTWVTTQSEASEDGRATVKTDLISPGEYHAKIFGDAMEGGDSVHLTMTMEKKLIIDGRFDLGIVTTGFPAGDYSIEAKAVNGSFNLDEMRMSGLSMGNLEEKLG